MSRRRGTASIVASPVLVGAVTVLVSIIAVFLAYNANAGLPFVPTYDLQAVLPTGAKLVKGNEVRVGGFRVGVVDDIQPVTVTEHGKQATRAKVALKLDKVVEPLPRDTRLRVRPRSALGLKYIELTRGRDRAHPLRSGSTVPVKNNSEPLELEDVLSLFDRKTRPAVVESTQGFGDAFAGRGTSLNVAIEELNPFFTYLTPVMTNLADPNTRIENFFRQLGRTSAQVAPVADVNARLFTLMANTFAAIGRDPRALQLTIEKGPATQDVSIRSFHFQEPFLADFADLSRRLRPAVQELPRGLPRINRAFQVGTPILPKTVPFNNNLRKAFGELEDLFDNPNTILALHDLRDSLAVTRPLIQFLNPYESVCNYANYFFLALGDDMSTTADGAFGGGTVQTQGTKTANMFQHNTISNTNASRPVDVMPGQTPRGATFMGSPAARLFGTPYPPAIDAQGNADCEIGQTGYPNGPLTVPYARYGGGFAPTSTGAPPNTIPAGGNGAIALSDYPILSGGTYKARDLGINNLRDVP